uniref:GP-PDE domain-containing protein n=1 Tax=Romanomermis culicivorax TaxID=13658 RepID=A0A915JZS9_ROMCU
MADHHLSDQIERFTPIDLILLAIFIFFFVSIFVADVFYRPMVVAAGFLAAVFGLKIYGARCVSLGAHRGLADDAPENTLEAFRLSKTLGADAIEFDVEFTKDDVAILMHDDTVDRTTNGTGNVRDLTWLQVQELDAAAKFRNGTHPPAKVPLLSQAVQYCLDNDMKIFFDIKRAHPKLVETLLDLYKQYPSLYDKAAVCSFDPMISYRVKRADNRIITAHTWQPYVLSYQDYERTKPTFSGLKQKATQAVETVYQWSLHNVLWKFTGADLILANHNMVSAEYIRTWKDRGLAVVAWTVNDYHQRLFFLKTLKCPFLTDKLSDFQTELKTTV